MLAHSCPALLLKPGREHMAKEASLTLGLKREKQKGEAKRGKKRKQDFSSPFKSMLTRPNLLPGSHTS